ncbi:hypothetical protein GGTG_10556 [Gaeumannomyces tritici R3-111a-1]|uniref:Uncharacterized protein n=1 Tax=Gaeumannomyces tritici (strain R3-111a-1) TaxID=644352 RepID=J3PAN1_GAET3|nr:hypothetical protein GGTG_10556 [Gaeumannomyces tritici R3-111a-1]EJT71297.1 hypothetical protein GGTG_10556 [Gaeumannomyces tritici R3-111a-1]
MSQSQPQPEFESDPALEMYQIGDAHRASPCPDLAAALAAPVTRFAVEFPQTSRQKPHFRFVVTFQQPLPGFGGACQKASVNMEVGPDGDGVGACVIRLLGNDALAGPLSHVGFTFPIRSALTLRAVVDAIAGEHRDSEAVGQTGDLAAFSYVDSGVGDDPWNGDRDWAVQVFCRLEAHGFVGNVADGVLGPGPYLGVRHGAMKRAPSIYAPEGMVPSGYHRTSLRTWDAPPTSKVRVMDWKRLFFDDIVDFAPKLREVWAGPGPACPGPGPVVLYDRLPLARGTFLDPAVKRAVLIKVERPLPYEE